MGINPAAVRQLYPCIASQPNYFLKAITMSSGVAVADDCKNYFEEIKKGKKYRYVIFFIKEEKSITVESLGERDAKYDDFLNDLQKAGDSECRYGLYDFEYEHQCQGTTDSSKAEAVPDVLVSRQCKNQEEDVVLLILRCFEEVSGWSPQIHPGNGL